MQQITQIGQARLALKAKLANGATIEVCRFIMLRNQCEIYVTEQPNERGICMALVDGLEQALRPFSIEKYLGHMIVNTDDISTDPESSNYLAPPIGGIWVD